MMMKKVILLIAVLLIVIPVFSQQDHDKIVEELSVTWWQVPVFALDANGNPITDLKEQDLEVILNGGKMPTFTLTKRFFTVEERKLETVEAPTATQTHGFNRKMVFLLFDLALSEELSIGRAKKVAEKIILEAEEDMRFYILTIDAFRGLAYIGEGSGKNKDNLVKMVREKIIVKPNRRIVDFTEICEDEYVNKMSGSGSKFSKYEAEDIPLFIENVAKIYKRKSMGFFYAFETLYFMLNSIEDNKFIYFFSEGMSKSIQTSNRSIAGGRNMYNFYIKRIGKYLERCGAVLFVINTMGVDQYTSLTTANSMQAGPLVNTFSSLSGEDSLHLLTKTSGGTYMEGTGDKIVERLEKVHRAYYEIAFPDPPQIKGMLREVKITSKRKGIKIITPKSLEKRKQYSQMNQVEKDMLALNLVTQPQNELIKSKIIAYNAQVEKIKKEKKHTTYFVTLPKHLLSTDLELYKIWLYTDNNGLSQVEKIERETLHTKKASQKIEFLHVEHTEKIEDSSNKENKNTESPGKIETYFVLVNCQKDPAKAYVHGLELYDEDPEFASLQQPESHRKKKGEQTISPEEMGKLLSGVSEYCEQLKQSVFHFYCQEKILETRIPLTDAENISPDISIEDMKRGVVRAMDEMRNKAYTKVNGYLFGYRLIKQGNSIKEHRDFIASRDEIPVGREDVLKTTAFFSEKAIFAPITLFDKTRQDKYSYSFGGYWEYNGRQVAMIDVVPKNPVETATIYGSVWIDTTDFSVIKIEANPASIRNYHGLEEFAKKLRTRLYLSLTLEFDFLREGIRFPTKVSMLEKYKGGRVIREYRGTQGWERIRAQFTYSDYQFFSVQTDVKIE